MDDFNVSFMSVTLKVKVCKYKRRRKIMKNVLFVCMFYRNEGICCIITVAAEVLKNVLTENI